LVEQHKGQGKINMDISGWKKTTKSGSMFLSIKAAPPYKKEEKPVAPVFDEAPF
jgi:hypothetical protein